ncbi:MAG: heavy-metal-associated domain-containing protein [Thermovirgaceae bacterium]
MAKLVFDVPDMSCDHCVRNITRALEKSGFSGFSVSLENKTVSLETDAPEKVRKVLEEAGYPATVRG